MEVFIGEEGLKHSWQEPFPKLIECPKCGEVAHVMFSVCEGEGEDTKGYVCDLKKDEEDCLALYWPHDAIACAVYWCTVCCEVTALFNQA